MPFDSFKGFFEGDEPVEMPDLDSVHRAHEVLLGADATPSERIEALMVSVGTAALSGTPFAFWYVNPSDYRWEVVRTAERIIPTLFPGMQVVFQPSINPLQMKIGGMTIHFESKLQRLLGTDKLIIALEAPPELARFEATSQLIYATTS